MYLILLAGVYKFLYSSEQEESEAEKSFIPLILNQKQSAQSNATKSTVRKGLRVSLPRAAVESAKGASSNPSSEVAANVVAPDVKVLNASDDLLKGTTIPGPAPMHVDVSTQYTAANYYDDNKESNNCECLLSVLTKSFSPSLLIFVMIWGCFGL